MSSYFGKFFHITSFGESHGKAIGVVIDGCPSGHLLDLQKLKNWMGRRKPGQSPFTTSRDEADDIEILSGIDHHNRTLGSPIAMIVRNTNFRLGDYKDIKDHIRPSHADLGYIMKYAAPVQPGSGRASARETIARVAAGAIAEQVLHHFIPDLKVVAYVKNIAEIEVKDLTAAQLDRSKIDQDPVKTIGEETSKKMQNAILQAKKQGDSLGGQIRCIIQGMPAGLGEPVFDKFEAELAKAMLSIPACKGFAIGSGLSASVMTGQQANDSLTVQGNQIHFVSNHSGGTQGGITNGNFVDFTVAFKPTSTIFKEQQTINLKGQQVLFKPEQGRHDPCVLPRAVPIVEAMALLCIINFYMGQKLQQSLQIPSAETKGLLENFTLKPSKIT